MKKIFSVLLVLSMLLSASATLAEGLGIQVIGGSMSETQAVSLDDLKLDEAAEIEGWGTLTLTESKFVDLLYQYKQGKTTVQGNWNQFTSGLEADYLILKANILNKTNKSADYLKDCEVKVIFNDDSVFAGWVFQYNWDNGTKDYDWDELNGIQNKEFVIDQADQFAIESWYEGHYCFGCTLPNAVINSKEPLRMVVTIDGNEITYNIRK